jgi:hypothetical protein
MLFGIEPVRQRGVIIQGLAIKTFPWPTKPTATCTHAIARTSCPNPSRSATVSIRTHFRADGKHIRSGVADSAGLCFAGWPDHQRQADCAVAGRRMAEPDRTLPRERQQRHGG